MVKLGKPIGIPYNLPQFQCTPSIWVFFVPPSMETPQDQPAFRRALRACRAAGAARGGGRGGEAAAGDRGILWHGMGKWWFLPRKNADVHGKITFFPGKRVVQSD